MNRGNEAKAYFGSSEKEEIAAALDGLQPQTSLGAKLLELSRRGLERGVEPLSSDEILEYLGHEPYENVH
ncbi:MAG: hypothetical protein SF097_19865 [Acidobacteriota bacterium]|nr:hypothetical protein [Acidobacteriota bacterium]